MRGSKGHRVQWPKNSKCSDEIYCIFLAQGFARARMCGAVTINFHFLKKGMAKGMRARGAIPDAFCCPLIGQEVTRSSLIGGRSCHVVTFVCGAEKRNEGRFFFSKGEIS
jgi:hypothetical protein